MHLAAFGGRALGPSQILELETITNPSQRTSIVSFRLTPEEVHDIDRQVSDFGFKTRSQWIRHQTQGEKTPAPVQLKPQRDAVVALYQLRYEIHQIGKNLNQLVALAHSRKIHSSHEFETVLDRLDHALEHRLGEVQGHVASLEDCVRGAER